MAALHDSEPAGNRAQRRHPATYRAKEVAERLGCSTWAIYKAVNDGTFPVAPIRVGRLMLWSKASIDALLAHVPHVG